MESIPKLVRERLKTKVPTSHPNTDLLTAFAEQSLRGKERAALMEHLAGCADCREVVALAEPEEGAATSRSKKIAWFGAPLLRWSAAVAAIVVVGAAVMLNRPRSAVPVPSAARVEVKSQVPETQVPQELTSKDGAVVSQLQTKVYDSSTPTAPSAKIASLKPPVTENKMHEKMAAPGNAYLKSPPSAPGAPPEGAPSSTAAAAADKWTGVLSAQQTEPDQQAPVPTANIPSASQSVEVVAAAPAASADAAEVSKAKRPAVDESGAAVGLQKNATANRSLTLTGRSAFQLNQLSFPRWTLAADGTLQRSFDSGKTWEGVAVAQGATFRAISAVGPEVWAGGRAGLLYHSTDAGQHWTRITPATADATLAADIARIEFTDPQHGKLVTADGQTWTTSDGGQTWQKQ